MGSRKSCESVNPYCASEPGEFPALSQIEPQAPLLGNASTDILPNWDSIDCRRIDHFDHILSASDGTCEKRATTNDNDAIDADMHARAGDAELILRTTQRRSAVMVVVCYSGAAATAGAAGAADSSTPVGASSLSLLWSSASGSITCASGSLSLASASASGA